MTWRYAVISALANVKMKARAGGHHSDVTVGET